MSRAMRAGHRRGHFVAVLLANPATAIIARLALASPFLLSGVLKLLDFPAAMQEAAGLGLGAPTLVAAATVTTQLLGSVLFLTHRFCWLGAGILAVFTAVATLIAHAFWQTEGLERMHQLATFFEHIAIIGGFAAAAILVSGRRNNV